MVTIEELLEVAKEKGASDLHITVGIPPKCRISGELTDMPYGKLLPEDTNKLIHSILSDYFAGILEDKGEVDFAYSIPRLGRYRVNIFKQRGSYALVIRLVGTTIPRPEELGIPESVLEVIKRKRGMVLVTGPAGSGKSTTLASMIDLINTTDNVHIITLEDPIEYLHAHKKSVVNQREVGLDTKSYTSALLAALREDPDVILVDEMRDMDTITTAIAAAQTGHLVFSTLHTIGAPAAIDHIIEIFPSYQQQQIRIQLASVLEAVISQQLISTSDGKGRVAAYEVMYATAAMKNLIRESKTQQITLMIQRNKKLGMQTMDDAIFDLYLKRKIDADKAIHSAQDPIALEKRMF